MLPGCAGAEPVEWSLSSSSTEEYREPGSDH
jgi:hypothetical protein